MLKKVAIVIPFYNLSLNQFEKISLERCFNILGDYEIKIILPKSFETDWIVNLTPAHVNLAFEKFDDSYFQNIDSYNRLLISPIFYSKFLDFEYILIHQLDVYIFSDELMYWCNKNYDYVASPWIDFDDLRFKFRTIYSKYLSITAYHKTFLKRIVYHLFPNYLFKKSFSIGNGGFSLRRVKIFYHISAQHESKNIQSDLNEDIFWSWYAPLFISNLRKPTLKKSLQFGFDVNPKLAFKKNSSQLPFGAHAFCRSDYPYLGNIDFWKEFLPGTFSF